MKKIILVALALLVPATAVKAEGNISGRSIGVYNDKYAPNYRCRFSMLNLQFNGNLLSCPSPLIDWAFDLLKIKEV